MIERVIDRKNSLARIAVIGGTCGALALSATGCMNIVSEPAKTMNDAAQDSVSDLSEVPVERSNSKPD